MSECEKHIAGDAALKETVLSETLLSGKDSFIPLYRQQVRLPNGKVSYRDIIRHPGACAILAIAEKDNVILERQWRAPLGCAVWEIPAGKIDLGEPSLVCAQRELTEETGLVASEWTFLGTLHNALGYSNEHIDVYLARGLKQGERHLDANEFLTVTRVPLSRVRTMAATGAITDAKTIGALFWLDAHLANLKRDIK
ncbi:MAG TPA: hypothetical protein DD376_00945 [Sutterella sp.]|nr:hypothetical protein [Sutterella sp.]